jgi:hypothetical protein
MQAVETQPSQVTQATGFQETPTFVPQGLDVLDTNLPKLDDWHRDVYDSETPPLDRQAGQFRQELGEVGEEVFGLSPEELSALPLGKKETIAAEITDVLISGYGTIRALDRTYDSLRQRHETDVYDAQAVSVLEMWQIDANGQDKTTHMRLSDFGIKALLAHKAYDELGTEDVALLTDKQKDTVAQRISEVMTSGLSVLNGINISFEKKFKEAYATMKNKYPKWLMDDLRAKGFSNSHASREAKKRFKSEFKTEVLPDGRRIYVPRNVQA